jgi:ATP:ADP antiporter, AAA family
MSTSSPFTAFEDRRVAAATIAAGLLVADQVMGKALRDTLFLAHVGIAQLPRAMLVSAILSGAVVVTLSRLARSRSPRRVASAALLASAALFALAWSLFPAYPRAGTMVAYFHTRALTPAAVSVFWTLVTHSFDPRLVRLAVPRVLAGATLGGVIGGLVTWRLAPWLSEPADLLLAGLVLSLGTLAFVARVRPGARTSASPRDDLGWRAFAGELPYLRTIALLVALTAITQALLDYLLSSAAATALGHGRSLLPFFALFQTLIAVLAFLLQVSVSPSLLARFGVGRVLAIAPLVIGAGTLSWPLLGPLVAAVLLRGADGVLGASLQRSAYEVLFAPLDDAKRRISKPIIDVAIDRAGTLIGGVVVAAAVALGDIYGTMILLGITGAMTVGRVALAPVLQDGYRRLLADSLQRARGALSSESILDPGTIHSLSASALKLDRGALLQEIGRVRRQQRARSGVLNGPASSLAAFDLPVTSELGEQASTSHDEVLEALSELRSGDEVRIRAVLQQARSEPLLTGQVLLLLADDRLARAAADWLSVQEPAPVGALSDALLGEGLGSSVRRRVARLIGKIDDQRAVQCLLDALPKVPTDVRAGVAQALARLASRRPIPREPLLAAVVETASSARASDDLLLKEIFTLLSAAYRDEPMHHAFRALAHEGELRGTALEWLDTVLPHEVKSALWPRIAPQEELTRPRRRSAEELREHLSSTDVGELDAEAEG